MISLYFSNISENVCRLKIWPSSKNRMVTPSNLPQLFDEHTNLILRNAGIHHHYLP